MPDSDLSALGVKLLADKLSSLEAGLARLDGRLDNLKGDVARIDAGASLTGAQLSALIDDLGTEDDDGESVIDSSEYQETDPEKYVGKDVRNDLTPEAAAAVAEGDSDDSDDDDSG